MKGPLSELRVLDLSRLMPFSYATQLLVDAGAEVVKLEAPGGEYGRGMANVFRLCNRGKRSVTLDLRRPEAREPFLELVGRFDVLLESFRPGYMSRLGLGWETLRERYPRLVYCAATGYGSDGPYARRPGHDLNYAAVAGLVSPTGEEPVLPPIPYIDMASGLAVAFGIAAAYAGARASGEGRFVDVGMADVALSFNLIGVAEGANSPVEGPADTPLSGYVWPDLMYGRCPCYGAYRAADGRWIALANVEPKFWTAFLEAIERPDLEPLRFATGPRGEAARAEIARAISARTSAEWARLLAERDVCFALVNTVADALRDEHLAARGIAWAGADSRWDVRSPVRFPGAEQGAPQGVPSPGEHNFELFTSLGYAAEDVRAWQRQGVV